MRLLRCKSRPLLNLLALFSRVSNCRIQAVSNDIARCRTLNVAFQPLFPFIPSPIWTTSVNNTIDPVVSAHATWRSFFLPLLYSIPFTIFASCGEKPHWISHAVYTRPSCVHFATIQIHRLDLHFNKHYIYIALATALADVTHFIFKCRQPNVLIEKYSARILLKCAMRQAIPCVDLLCLNKIVRKTHSEGANEKPESRRIAALISEPYSRQPIRISMHSMHEQCVNRNECLKIIKALAWRAAI